MSLLMKALEKAARDRGEAPTTKGPATTPVTPRQDDTLKLEPVIPKQRTTAETQSAASSDAAAASPATTPVSVTSRTTRSASARTREQVQAGTLALAQSKPPNEIGPWLRDHPIVVFGSIAGLFLFGYGVYVYLQVAHPGLFTRQPAAPAAIIVAKAPLQQRTTEPVSPVLPGDSTRLNTLIPSSAIVGQSVDVPPQREPAPASSSVQPTPSSAASTLPAKPPAKAVAAAATPSQPRNKVVVSRGDTNAPKVNPLAIEAYAALETGRFDDAQRIYAQLARAEPRNIDALLGLAALAQRENHTDDASRLYFKVLELDPRHALAQAGLISIVGRADPLSAESRLKQLAAREPSAFIYFTLGNLYADQSRWAQAQRAYFQAHHLDPENPEYAYNLAIGLEHLGQHKFALEFYRRALQLASVRSGATFSLTQAQGRITHLASRVE
jgi:Tfp pilus assembly protein PilF